MKTEKRKLSSLFFTLLHLSPWQSQQRGKKVSKKKEESNISVQIRDCSLSLSSQMGALQALVLFLILRQACNIMAEDDELKTWKSATATYTKEAQGSIIVEGACGYGDLHKASYGKYSAGLSTIPSVILTATDFCPPNYGLSSDYGGWCNFPKEHFEMSEAAFGEIAEKRADIVPVQYRRVKCMRIGGLRFTVSGSAHFYQVLVTSVGLDGEVIGVKVKGSRTGWIPMARNWGQIWQSNVNLTRQPLSFEVTTSSRRTLTPDNVAPANWQFGQTYEGKQF
ncbi:hypothetical protein Pint_33804 [Pistacia integerrima]|uniref:Uncharacterized protein n=1 Tax=Pistacia integerrima TaxID=434235 RepID=A0ACC0X5R2_9ROSI|nr:hypothetical protein Pint_33804 [Pistacia integerrima]